MVWWLTSEGNKLMLSWARSTSIVGALAAVEHRTRPAELRNAHDSECARHGAWLELKILLGVMGPRDMPPRSFMRLLLSAVKASIEVTRASILAVKAIDRLSGWEREMARLFIRAHKSDEFQFRPVTSFAVWPHSARRCSRVDP